MRLLFDQNLSYRLVTSLAQIYPNSQHVRMLGLDNADDELIWRYAKEHGFMLCSKDSDFYHRSMVHGHPPKVAWIRLGNCTTEQITTLLQLRQAEIQEFNDDDAVSFFILH